MLLLYRNQLIDIWFSCDGNISLNPFQPSDAFHIEISYLIRTDLHRKSNDWFLYEMQLG